MAFEASVIRGLGQPHSLRIRVANKAGATEALDLSTVTAVEFAARDRRTNTVTTWAASIESQSAEALAAVHMFDDDEIPEPRTIELTVRMTVAGQTRIAGPSILYVV